MVRLDLLTASVLLSTTPEQATTRTTLHGKRGTDMKMNMLMKRTSRVRNNGRVACHDSCDSNMSPYNVKKMRRHFKRSERQQWKKEV